jgi:raffinose/stachyose/melibiose transport system permease protein
VILFVIALVMAVLYQQLILSRDTRPDVVTVKRTKTKKVIR